MTPLTIPLSAQSTAGGYQRIADIYGLPVNIIQDPLNRKFIAWLGRPGASRFPDRWRCVPEELRAALRPGATIGPIVETIVPQKPSRGPPEDHGLESNADPRSVSTDSMREASGFPAAPVADFH
jgi:hypothetical protein